MAYCNQCYGACTSHNACPNTYCELRKLATGSLEKTVEKPLMTRQEAITKVQAIFHSSWTGRDVADFVDALEDLGVLKLKCEVERDPLGVIMQTHGACDAQTILQNFDRAGYKIVKK